MKSENLTKKVLCFVLAIIIAVFCNLTVFAVGEEDNSNYTEPSAEYVEPTTEQYEPVVTDPPAETEPYVETEPTTAYVPDTTIQEQTLPAAEEPTEAQTYVQNIDPIEETTEHFEAPTLAKTVSNKKYSTNYTAGIVSWACVGIGVLVIAVVLISNKVSGRKIKGSR